jgi:hypothetical protein
MTNLTHSFLTYLFHASTCFEQRVIIIRKHVEAWNKYIKKECVKLVINQNYVKMHGQQNIKFIIIVHYSNYHNHHILLGAALSVEGVLL